MHKNNECKNRSMCNSKVGSIATLETHDDEEMIFVLGMISDRQQFPKSLC